MFRGRLASLHDERDRSIGFYTTAAERFRALEMPLHEAATRFRLGELLPGDDGKASVSQAIQWFESQQVKNPDALIRMVLP